jgi:hypothetical protein
VIRASRRLLLWAEFEPAASHRNRIKGGLHGNMAITTRARALGMRATGCADVS